MVKLGVTYLKKIQLPMLLLAFLVVFCFIAVSLAIGFRSFLLAFFFLILGFALMGFGFTLKRKYREQ